MAKKSALLENNPFPPPNHRTPGARIVCELMGSFLVAALRPPRKPIEIIERFNGKLQTPSSSKPTQVKLLLVWHSQELGLLKTFFNMKDGSVAEEVGC